jgi:arginyl-tRNA synthetase
MAIDKFKLEIIKSLSDATGKEITEDQIEIPPSPEMGDYAFPCFPLAKELKKNPVLIAKDISEKIKPNKYISQIKVLGAYVNFFVVKEILSKKTLTEIFEKKENYGSQKKKEYTVMVESPGPNTNKPLHLGHVRNMLLGNALENTFRFLGYKTVRVDMVNDRGIHICKSMLAYHKFGNDKTPDKKTDHFVGDYYVLYSKEAETHPEMETEIQDMLKKWEDNDPDTKSLWRKMNDWVLAGINETYIRYGVKMERPYYESDHYAKGKDAVKEGLAAGIFKKDEKGNIYFSDDEIEKKIILRADGTSIYITQDIVLGKIRYEDYHMDKLIYIVANEQIHHFKVLFKIFDLLKYPFAKDCYHLAYGMIYLPEGKMKSREGTVVDADTLADDMQKIAKEEIIKRDATIFDTDADKRAEEIGMAAIKFFILKYDALKDFIYNPKESISFDGETGPYVQYTHARISSVLRKYDKKVNSNVDFSLLNTEEDKKILRLLEEFPETIEKSAEHYKPSMITRHLLDLSQAFNEYYHKHKIIQEDAELEKARLLLIYCVKQVLETGLNLLGINAPDVM